MREEIFRMNTLLDREAIHDAFAERFSFPDYYGRNLDALHDCLTDMDEDTRIVLDFGGMSARRLPSYPTKLLRVLLDSASENEHLELLVR